LAAQLRTIGVKVYRESTYKDQATRRYTRALKGIAVAGFSPERNSAQRWRSASRKGMAVKGVGDGVLLLHKQEEDIRN
jgi:hypothetical protein